MICLLLVGDAFAQEIQAGRNTLGVQGTRSGKGVVYRLTGNEALGESSREAVVPNELKCAPLVAEPEERATQQRLSTLAAGVEAHVGFGHPP